MQEIKVENFEQWPKAKIVKSIIAGLLLLGVSLILNYAAGTYASLSAGNIVNDIILDNLPTFNVNFIFVYGFIAFVIFFIFLVAYKPKRLPFFLKSLSLFIIVRSFFVILTHLGPIAKPIPDNLIDIFTFSGDLFFSSHTGMPFLAALLFWKSKNWRYVFLGLSLIFGATVLLGHLHYSIDVFSAFFITYGIFHLAKTFFSKDYKLFQSTEK